LSTVTASANLSIGGVSVILLPSFSSYLLVRINIMTMEREGGEEMAEGYKKYFNSNKRSKLRNQVVLE
jgi:hypothetical protein